MDWSQILGAAGTQEQQGQIDQQLADLLARRRAYQPYQATTGIGAALGGLGDILRRKQFDTQEAGLRQQRQDLSGQMAAGRGNFLQQLMQAQQGGGQAPAPEAPGGMPSFGSQPDPQRQQQLGMAGMLSGDPVIQGYLQHAPQMEMAQENLRKAQEERTALATPEAGAAGRQLLSKFGFGVSEATPNATVRALLPTAEKGYAAETSAQARRDVARMNMGGGGSMLDPAALDQAAEMYATTGQLPSMGMGAAGSALKRQIANRAAELRPEANLAGNKAGFHADQASLGKIQTQADALNAFERTALANLDQFLNTAKSVVDTTSPLFNMPARRFMQTVAGDPKMAQFSAARQVAVQEISRVLGGSLGGVVSDSARHEASGLLGPDASLAQIQAAAEILKQDMHNRRQSMETELGVIRGRAGGKSAAAPAPAAPAQPAAPATRPRRTVNGETREWDGQKWVAIGQ